MTSRTPKEFRVSETDATTLQSDTSKHSFDIGTGRIRTNPEKVKEMVDLAKRNVSSHEDIEEMYSDLKNQGHPIHNEYTKDLFNSLISSLKSYEQLQENEELPTGSYFWKKIKNDASKGINEAIQVINAWNTIEKDGCKSLSTKEAISHLSGEEIRSLKNDNLSTKGLKEAIRYLSRASNNSQTSIDQYSNEFRKIAKEIKEQLVIVTAHLDHKYAASSPISNILKNIDYENDEIANNAWNAVCKDMQRLIEDDDISTSIIRGTVQRYFGQIMNPNY